MSAFDASPGAIRPAAIDIALMERVAARDGSALAELYDRHSRLLYSLALRIMRDAGHAEDVLQEVFLLVWTRVHTYNAAIGPPIAWLVRITRNRAIDRLRTVAARLRADDTAAPATMVADDNPEDDAELSEQWRAAAQALDTLPAEQRLLVEDAYFLGLTHGELAARHGLPLGTVKTRIRSGMQTLRQSLTSVSARP
ncbi:MAG: sigma-70 family RNA polymerase sigma factor [Vicinamibacterales bacterium]